MTRIISMLFAILLFSTDVKAQQSAITVDQETSSSPRTSTGSGRSSDGLLDPNTVWNDPSARYRMLDPWRLSVGLGGGMLILNDMRGTIRTGTTGISIPGQKAEDTAGLFTGWIELSGKVSQSENNDWYMVSLFSYDGRSVDNPVKIRSGTHTNEAAEFTLLSTLNRTEILNRNQTNALTGIRVHSRNGQLSYRGGLLTGIASRKWYEEDLIWVTQLELELGYRLPDALFGPFGALVARAGLDSEEVAGIEALGELGIRYVSDVENSLIAQIDGFLFLEGGKWNDDTSQVQVIESRGAFGLGGRLRVWNLLLAMRFGYILDYSFEENRTSGGPQGIRRRMDGSGDFQMFVSLQAEF